MDVTKCPVSAFINGSYEALAKFRLFSNLSGTHEISANFGNLNVTHQIPVELSGTHETPAKLKQNS